MEETWERRDAKKAGPRELVKERVADKIVGNELAGSSWLLMRSVGSNLGVGRRKHELASPRFRHEHRDA